MARALRRQGAPVALVPVEQLLLAPVFEHDPSGPSRIVLGSGLELVDASIGLLFCRIRGIDPPQFRRAAEADRLYAQEEFYALILSWLAGLGERVVNRPQPASLHGMRCGRLEELLRSARSTGRVHGFAAASEARRLPPGEGPVVAGPADAGRPAAGGIPASVLAGGPAMRLPPVPERGRWQVTVVGERVLGAEPPAEARSLALRLALERGLSFASIELLQLAAGGFGHGMIDPLPPLERREEVEAVADHLLRMAFGGVA